MNKPGRLGGVFQVLQWGNISQASYAESAYVTCNAPTCHMWSTASWPTYWVTSYFVSVLEYDRICSGRKNKNADKPTFLSIKPLIVKVQEILSLILFWNDIRSARYSTLYRRNKYLWRREDLLVHGLLHKRLL